MRLAFTLVVRPRERGGYDFTLVRPNTTYVSGDRDSLAEVMLVMAREMDRERESPSP